MLSTLLCLHSSASQMTQPLFSCRNSPHSIPKSLGYFLELQALPNDQCCKCSLRPLTPHSSDIAAEHEQCPRQGCRSLHVSLIGIGRFVVINTCQGRTV